ncbi:glycosyltransferase family 4 protein [Luteimonas sp. MC1782]|uniref:glycosyltransferase family 4 protein n=1 Tax=Luteimonas sp. MC1782 TaxID=2760305 RepID=UPI0016009BDB|nr:glycosyltransferase family 4 protein [Luteimonas sp. MC1782]MBB1472228.1 glycosyltransferase family 4 protein [Luteimonas sp. MC1782]
MRLLINTSILRFGGAVQVALSFIHECRSHPQHEYHVVLGPGVGAVLDPAAFPSNFHFQHSAFGVMGLRATRRVHREMVAIEAQVRPDCVVTTSGPSYWRSRAPHLMGFNLPLYIYPESPYVQALSPVRKLRLAARRWLHCRYFRRDADAFIVQTDDVNERVRRLFASDRVHTVTNNCSGWYNNPPSHAPRLPPRADGVFRFLTLSSYYAHKNLELIPKVVAALPEHLRNRVEFVLTLDEETYRRRISTSIPPQLRLTGPVPPPECPALYAECDAMFLPTLAECFSASYPEAMRMGTPIVTTDLGFARSICQDAALYFNAGDAESAAGEVARLVEDPALQATLRERGAKRLAAFDTPAQRAEKILEICEQSAAARDYSAGAKSARR